MANLKKKSDVVQMYGDTYTDEFLCGYTDEDGVLHTEFEYREMDGSDEEAINRNTIKNSGSKIVSTILDRCIVRIGSIIKAETKPAKWTEIIKSLLVPDQDYALIAIRKISVGSEITVKHTCPSCKRELTTETDVDELEVIPYNGDNVLEFELKKGYVDKDGEVHKTGKVRFPNGLDREIVEPTARNNLATANTLLLSRIITELGTLKNVNDAVVRKLTSGDRQLIMKVLEDNNFGYKFEVSVDCPNCGHEFSGQLSAVNFL